MIKTIKINILFLFVVLTSSFSYAVSLSTIDSTGLAFTDPSTTAQVKTILCPFQTFQTPFSEPACIQQFVNGKIIDKIPDTTIQQISVVNPGAAESIKTFHNVKDVLNNGNEIVSVLVLDEKGAIFQGALSFGNTGNYVGTFLGLKSNKDAFAQNLKIDFTEKYNLITFLDGNYFELLQRERKTVFDGIKSQNKDTISYLKLNFTGNITEADFTTLSTKPKTFIIENDKIYVPANSRLIYKNGKVNLQISDNADLKEVPKLLNSDIFGNVVEVKGKNIKLPGGNVLNEGTITYINGVPYVKTGDRALINGIDIKPTSGDIELKFSSKGFIRSAGEYFGLVNKESGNFVRITDKIEANGNGVSVGLNPSSFVGNNPSESYLSYMNDLSVSSAKNEKYFTLGDKGEDVKLIQKLVGVKEDGVYGTETSGAVKIWQKENGLNADGLFGPESLKTALGFDNTKNVVIAPNGGRVLISSNNDALNMDFTGKATFKVGSEIFYTDDIKENSYLKSLSFSGSNNKKSFQIGDEGKDVKLIQKFFGLDQTGKFDEKTEQALRSWQSSSGIVVDGKFGPESLKTASTDKTEIYRNIKEHINNNAEVPVDITLRNSDGSINKKLSLKEPTTAISSKEVISSIEKINIGKNDNEINVPLKTGNYIYLDRSTQKGYYIENGEIIQGFRIGIGTGNNPNILDSDLSTPKGEFTVHSVEYNKPVGKWAKDIPFGLLKEDEGYASGIKGRLLSVYGPGFIVMQDNKGRIIQEGIHGTNPLGMGQLLLTPSGKRYVSHGCIRMLNDDWRNLVSNIKKGTKVIIG